jgi:hypothetical protein
MCESVSLSTRGHLNSADIHFPLWSSTTIKQCYGDLFNITHSFELFYSNERKITGKLPLITLPKSALTKNLAIDELQK